jgi:MFS family permease
VFSSLGRAFFGALSDKFSYYVSRTSFLNFCVFLTMISNFCMAFAPLYLFYGIIPVFALSYGGLYSLGPAFISERFGPKYFAINFALSNTGAVAGNYLISVLLVSTVYQSHIHYGKTCHGYDCFRLTFFFTTALCLISFLLGLLLMKRTTRMYTRLYYARHTKH